MTELYIEQTLQDLHINRRYTGRGQLADSVGMALADENALLKLQRRIYTPVAARYNSTAGSVERNIRTVSRVAWETSPDALQKMAGYALYGPPSAAELIEILLTHIQRTWPETRS